MPIDPFAALNAMLRAEAARSTEAEEVRRTAEAEADVPESATEGHRPSLDDGAA
ncbi:hypothetical protein HRW18_15785 [Streptomyces lunaelactis]|uniref:hypothetical protein n=1 Tax=Streptomyces lunaelactis TaxID=1535768 RepID=UPI0015845881|nr:hypothetical protein [Streptomyces lunaelactis]NUK09439.1 hypothetical protein [Streptomyces lunaelactis]NUL10759.1 hypothetical protein [Streptomyces lunaelactis]NUL27929.1 hypothetical protein [Streptomyces lunaelactis]